MNRRYFLSTTALSGLGLVTLSGAARAFSLQECEADPRTAACNTIAEHDDVIAQLNAMLVEKGVDEGQRRSILASALCPFCGQLLLPS